VRRPALRALLGLGLAAAGPADLVAGDERGFTFAGVSLRTTLAEIRQRHPRSAVAGSHVFVAPEEVRDHVWSIEVAAPGLRARLGFERPREVPPGDAGQRFPACLDVQRGLEARYGPPAEIREFWEERMRHADRVWVRDGETLTLVCFVDDRQGLLAEAVIIVPPGR
jgi:hypothetical protein